jgi:hypothetical protein
LRDRALIGLVAYSFARVGAVLQMKVGDYFVQVRRGWVRLHEKAARSMTCPVKFAGPQVPDANGLIAACADGNPAIAADRQIANIVLVASDSEEGRHAPSGVPEAQGTVEATGN